jgi:hypothetical protein
MELETNEVKEILTKVKYKCINGDPDLDIIFNNKMSKLDLVNKFGLRIVNVSTKVLIINKLMARASSALSKEFALEFIKKEVVYCYSYMDRMARKDAANFKKVDNNFGPANKIGPKITERARKVRRWKSFITKLAVVQKFLGNEITYKFQKDNRGLNFNHKYKWLRNKYPSYIKKMKERYPKNKFIV